MERQTRQRDALLEAFTLAGRPLTAQEAHQLASKTVRRIGIGTVYRNLRTFVDEALLTPVDLPGEALRYELAGKDHHHHFQCRECDRVFDVAGCSSALHKGVPKGFRVDAHEVVLYGACARCA